jgi:hypothetical protein
MSLGAEELWVGWQVYGWGGSQGMILGLRWGATAEPANVGGGNRLKGRYARYARSGIVDVVRLYMSSGTWSTHEYE